MKISKLKRGLSLLLVLALLIGMMPVSTFANTGTTNAGFEAILNITSEWGNSYSGNIILKNNGTTPIQDWKINFNSQDLIESIWDAEIIERSASSYIVKNKGWNADINPGGNVSFGFNARTNGSNKGITNIKLITDTGSNTSPGTLEDNIFFKVTSDWGTAFNAQIEIKNTTATAIQNWSLVFDFDRNIGSIWNATIVERANGRYVLANAGWNASIPPGGSIIIGFDGTEGNVANNSARNFVLYYNGKTDIVIPTPTATPIPTPTGTPTPTPTLSPIQDISRDVFPAELFKDNAAIPSIKLSGYGNPDELIDLREGIEFAQIMDENPFYIGKVIDIQLSDMVVEGEINFDLAENRPFNETIICRIDPVTGETLPLETILDGDGNIAAELDGGGCYFVMDLGEFFDYLDIDLIELLNEAVDEVAEPAIQLYSAATSSYQVFDIFDSKPVFEDNYNAHVVGIKLGDDAQYAINPDTGEATIYKELAVASSSLSSYATNASSGNLDIDVIFVLKATPSVMGRKNEFLSLFESIALEMEKVPGVSPKFSFATYGGDPWFDCTFATYFDSAKNMRNYANHPAFFFGQGYSNMGTPLFTLNSMLANFYKYGRGSAVKRVVLITDDDIREDRTWGSFNLLLDNYVINNTALSVITESSKYDQSFKDDLKFIGGDVYSLNNVRSIAQDLAKPITRSSGEVYVTLDGALGIHRVKLDKKIDPNDRVTDTDKDGFPDSQEVIPYPKTMDIYAHAVHYILNAENPVYDPYKRIIGPRELVATIPIAKYGYNSLPHLEDSDGDGIPDKLDPQPLVPNYQVLFANGQTFIMDMTDIAGVETMLKAIDANAKIVKNNDGIYIVEAYDFMNGKVNMFEYSTAISINRLFRLLGIRYSEEDNINTYYKSSDLVYIVRDLDKDSKLNYLSLPDAQWYLFEFEDEDMGAMELYTGYIEEGYKDFHSGYYGIFRSPNSLYGEIYALNDNQYHFFGSVKLENILHSNDELISYALEITDFQAEPTQNQSNDRGTDIQPVIPPVDYKYGVYYIGEPVKPDFSHWCHDDFVYDKNAKATLEDYKSWYYYGLLLNGGKGFNTLPKSIRGSVVKGGDKIFQFNDDKLDMNLDSIEKLFNIAKDRKDVDLSDALALYAHYRSASGKTKSINLNKAYRDDENIGIFIDNEIAVLKNAVYNWLIDSSDYFESLSSQTEKFSFQVNGGLVGMTTDYYGLYPTTENWQKTLGDFLLWIYADIIYDAKNKVVTAKIDIHSLDYYNFNRDAKDVFTGLPDKSNGRFVELGWAKPFISEGHIYLEYKWIDFWED